MEGTRNLGYILGDYLITEGRCKYGKYKRAKITLTPTETAGIADGDEMVSEYRGHGYSINDYNDKIVIAPNNTHEDDNECRLRASVKILKYKADVRPEVKNSAREGGYRMQGGDVLMETVPRVVTGEECGITQYHAGGYIVWNKFNSVVLHPCDCDICSVSENQDITIFKSEDGVSDEWEARHEAYKIKCARFMQDGGMNALKGNLRWIIAFPTMGKSCLCDMDPALHDIDAFTLAKALGFKTPMDQPPMERRIMSKTILMVSQSKDEWDIMMCNDPSVLTAHCNERARAVMIVPRDAGKVTDVTRARKFNDANSCLRDIEVVDDYIQNWKLAAERMKVKLITADTVLEGIEAYVKDLKWRVKTVCNVTDAE
jgi:hypothetical protein